MLNIEIHYRNIEIQVKIKAKSISTISKDFVLGSYQHSHSKVLKIWEHQIVTIRSLTGRENAGTFNLKMLM